MIIRFLLLTRHRAVLSFRTAALCAALLLPGCGYTVVRNLDEEALQAEWNAIDSLTVGPDLTISDVEYEYIPEYQIPPRSHGENTPVEHSRPIPAEIIFYIKVANVGNAEFAQPYFLIWRNLYGWPKRDDAYHEAWGNRKRDTISVNGVQELDISLAYPGDSASFSFTIATNPIIQENLLKRLPNSNRTTREPPLTRELRYDNNETVYHLPDKATILRAAAEKSKLLVGDFSAGPIGANQPSDSLSLARLFGAPVKVETALDNHQSPGADTSQIFDFDSVKVGLSGGIVGWVEFSSSTLATYRGVRVGDPARKVRKLYGLPAPETWLRPPDTPNEYILSYFKANSLLGIAFQIREDRVVKIVIGWGPV